MADETDVGATPAAPPTATTADAGTQPTAAGSDEPLINKREFVELRKDVRDQNKRLDSLTANVSSLVATLRTQGAKSSEAPKQEQTPAQADAALEAVKELRRELQVRDAFLSLGVTQAEHRELLEAAVAQKRPENIAEFVERYASSLGVKVQRTATTPATVPVPVTSAAPAAAPPAKPAPDTGPPGTVPAALSTDLAHMDPAVFRGMTRDQRLKLVGAAIRKGNGQTGNPMFPAGHDAYARPRGK